MRCVGCEDIKRWFTVPKEIKVRGQKQVEGDVGRGKRDHAVTA